MGHIFFNQWTSAHLVRLTLCKMAGKKIISDLL